MFLCYSWGIILRDVFASIATFFGKDTKEMGLNSVLDGVVFVSCIVVGVVSICIAERMVQIDKKCFIRDLCFFLFSLMWLGLILLFGEVTIGGVVAFVLIYGIYAFVVATNEILRKHAQRLKMDVVKPLLPIMGSMFPFENAEDESLYTSLLELGDKSDAPLLQNNLPHWMWASHVAIYSNYSLKASSESPKYVGLE